MFSVCSTHRNRRKTVGFVSTVSSTVWNEHTDGLLRPAFLLLHVECLFSFLFFSFRFVLLACLQWINVLGLLQRWKLFLSFSWKKNWLTETHSFVFFNPVLDFLFVCSPAAMKQLNLFYCCSSSAGFELLSKL